MKIDKILLLDNEYQVTLTDFIEANTSNDVVPIPEHEIIKLNNLKIGESIVCGSSDVKRIK